jgi:hypothetical protein
MPTYPDDQTLHFRRPDRRSLAELVALARRELAPRPAHRELRPTPADVSLSVADRRLASFRERYPGAFERVHASMWWAVANGYGRSPGGPGRAERCPGGWCMALAYARYRRLPAPRVDQVGRALLGDPGPRCQAALGWQPPKPKPKPRARPAGRSRSAARSSTSTRTRTPATASTGRHAAARTSRRPRRRPSPAELAAATRAGLTAAAFLPAHPPRPIAPDTPANRAAVARQYRQTGSPSFTPAGMGWPATPPTRRGRR